MRQLALPLAALLAAACGQSADPKLDASEYLAFTDATVLDMTGAPPRRDTTVVVFREFIVEVGPRARAFIPEGARVVDASGRWLLPGFWDMHVHLRDVERTLPLLVANGIVGVRDMGNRPEQVLGWRREINQGRRLGPQIAACNPVSNRPEPANPDDAIANGTADEARPSLASLWFDCIKVHEGMPRNVYFAIAEDAARYQAPLVGQVPSSVTAWEAADAGQRTIDHLSGLLEGSSSLEGELRRQMVEAPSPVNAAEYPARIAARGTRTLDTWNQTKADRLFRHLATRKVWMVPTLAAKRAQAFADELAAAPDPRLLYVPAAEWYWWSPDTNFFLRHRTPEYVAWRKRAFNKEMEVVKGLDHAGVRFLAGTGAPGAWLYPGFSLHDELELLVEAGLTPYEALAAATRNPADHLGDLVDDGGQIVAWKAADLVLLAADPLADIRNVRKIEGVMVRGRWLDRPALDRLLAVAESVAAGRAEATAARDTIAPGGGLR